MESVLLKIIFSKGNHFKEDSKDRFTHNVTS